jgi:hypothetical protein
LQKEALHMIIEGGDPPSGAAGKRVREITLDALE